MKLRENWLHDRQCFYKYLTAESALKVIQNRSLKYSSPLLFNDPFDIQFDLHVDYDRSAVASLARDRDWAIYGGLIPFVPINAAGDIFAFFRTNLPNLSREEYDHEFAGVFDECMKSGEAGLARFHSEFRSSLQDVKVLCLSEAFDNILMWSHYAERHAGCVLRLSCVPELDSVWGAAQAVCYQREMPRLFTQDEMVKLLTGEFNLSVKDTLNKVVLTKAMDWSYEKEWRVVLHMTNPDEQSKFIRFAPAELSAIYLGCNSTANVRSKICDAASSVNPRIELFQGRKSATEFALNFERVN